MNPVPSGPSLLAVSWTAPSDTGSSAISSYSLRYRVARPGGIASASWTVVQSVWNLSHGGLSYDLTGLQPSVRYELQMRAVNNSGPGLWSATVSGTTGPEPEPQPVGLAFARNPALDINGLANSGRDALGGLWSDGTTLWVGDLWESNPENNKLYAYDAKSKARLPNMEFDTLGAAGNTVPTGLWADGNTMWVADYSDGKIYAYHRDSMARKPAEDFNSLITAGNTRPGGIWSDGTTMWVGNRRDGRIFAYDLRTKARVASMELITPKAAGNNDPWGIWSDGTTLWVADSRDRKIYAYDLSTKERSPSKEFNTLANSDPTGIWSDGVTMWVADWENLKIFAYNMPPGTGTAVGPGTEPAAPHGKWHLYRACLRPQPCVRLQHAGCIRNQPPLGPLV